MIHLNKMFKSVLTVSVLCIILVHAMKPQYRVNKDLTISQQISGFKKCKDKMREIFKMPLDSPPINFVKYGIKHLLLESGITNSETQRNLGEDVIEYYESFDKALFAESIQTKQEFCFKFTSDKSKIERMTEFLYARQQYVEQSENSNILRFQVQTPEEKNKYCIFYLALFGRKKEDHLYAALYLRSFWNPVNPLRIMKTEQVDISWPIEDDFYHRPDSYEYYFLDDIAERVLINGIFYGPDRFCSQKYLFKSLSDSSTSSSSSQANNQFDNRNG